MAGGSSANLRPVAATHDCFCPPHLCTQVSGQYKDVPRPVDMSALFTVGSVSATGFLFPFMIGTEVTIQVRQQPGPDVPRCGVHSKCHALPRCGVCRVLLSDSLWDWQLQGATCV